MTRNFERVRITHGGETVTMAWNGAEASAPIYLDGETTPYQTASARHSTARAVRLCARLTWPEVGDFAEGSQEWDELEYEALENEREDVC